MNPLKIGFVSSEMTPLAKTGGLADVSAALPLYLHRAGHDVRPFLPFYSAIDTRELEIHAVDFLRQVPLPLGDRELRFDGYTARLPDSDLWVYLLRCPELYDRDEGLYTSGPDEHLRFAVLARGALACCQRMGFGPDVLHGNDWHAGLLPLYLRTLYEWDALFGGTRSVLTIHNIGYQGVFGAGTVGDLGLDDHAHLLHQDDLREDRINFLKTGILYADLLTTVSPSYAREIQRAEYGMGLEGLLQARRHALVGILNGVDYSEWDPAKDRFIACRYSTANLPAKGRNKRALLRQMGLPHAPRIPVIGIVSRLTSQKGFDLGFEVLPDLLRQRDFRLTVLGSGDEAYERFFAELAVAFPEKVAFHAGYSNELAHRIEAGADLFLMPSRYEPCGLNQMFSLRYGTLPIVRRTGGLADTVVPFDPQDPGRGNGFAFDDYTPEGLRRALELALDTYADRKLWRRMMLDAMSRDFSWDAQGEQYVNLYARLIGR